MPRRRTFTAEFKSQLVFKVAAELCTRQGPVASRMRPNGWLQGAKVGNLELDRQVG